MASVSNDDKRMQLIDLKETFAYRTKKIYLISNKEWIKCNKKCKNFDDITKESTKEHNSNCPKISN